LGLEEDRIAYVGQERSWILFGEKKEGKKGHKGGKGKRRTGGFLESLRSTPSSMILGGGSPRGPGN